MLKRFQNVSPINSKQEEKSNISWLSYGSYCLRRALLCIPCGTVALSITCCPLILHCSNQVCNSHINQAFVCASP